MKIAVIGTGSIGGTLGTRWAKQGRAVTFATRDPNSGKVRRLLAEAGSTASAASIADAAADAEIVVLAVPWRAAQPALQAAGDLSGKIVVDCTNAVGPDLQPAVGTAARSGAEQVAAWASGARVVKAFNTTGWENLADPLYQGESVMMPFCGDDPQAKAAVHELIALLGLEPVDVGGLETAWLLEALALVWIRLSMVQGEGRGFAFKVARR